MDNNTADCPAATTRRGRSGWWKFGYGLWLTLNIIVAAGLICSCYAGELSPRQVAVAGVVCMTLPGWFAMSLLMTVANFIWWRRTSALLLLVMLVCARPLWNFCPLNLPPGRLDPEEKERSFTVLTYNTLGLIDQEGMTTPNRAVEYILAQNADIVCLQELYSISATEYLGITGSQIDELHRRYPYILFSQSHGLMSKFPVKALHIEKPLPDADDANFAVFQIEVQDRLITVFNCHLQSIGLTGDDKKLYRRITDGHAGRRSAGEVKSRLLSKLISAGRLRAAQTELICRYIKHYGGDNVIVCGDFNDVPDCYSLRRLADFGLHEVYPQVGFGPMITYNANRFYFRIDHVLYRGCFKAHSMVRGSVRCSDHYPLTTTFVFDQAD